MSVKLPFLDKPSSPPETQSKYSITGIVSFGSVPGIRRNIVKFSDPTEPDASIRRQWNLYLMGLSRFQAIDEKGPLSYYQVAGIHGAPFMHWMEEPEPGDRPGNYCTHSSSLFLTWHRPYLLLFEQRVVEEALKYVSEMDDKHRELYEKEASQVRVPYWDWATDHNLPDAVRNREVEIDLPRPKGEDGPAKRTIENPLYSYKFKSQLRITRDFGLLDSVWWPDLLETRRCPSWDHGYPSDMQAASDQLVNPKDPEERLPTNYRDGMHHLLTKIPDYGPFSNTGYWKDKEKDKETAADNTDYKKDEIPAVYHFTLESYHNSVHNYTGTNYRLENNPDDRHEVPPTGHMSDVPVSAFDPIFWLHHANIDRIYAMWQSINPDAKFQDQKVEPTRLPPVESLDALDKIGGSLRPFYRKESTDDYTNEYKVWNSGMVQCGGGAKPRVFDYGYTYPEVLYSLRDDEAQLKRYVLEQTNILYQPLKDNTYHELKPSQLDPSRPIDVLGRLKAKGVSVSAGISAQSFSELLAEHIEDDDVNKARYRRSWTINLVVKRFIVKGNFTIFFFLGKPSDNPSTWIADPQQIGSFSTFKSQAEKCTNCASQELEGAVMKAGLDITEDLFKFKEEEGANFADLNDTENITNWLKKKFTWRMLEHDSRESVDLTRLLQREPEGLTVKVSSFIVPFPIGKIQPILGAPDGTPVQGNPDVVFPPVDFSKFGLFDEQVHEIVTKRKHDIGGYSV